MSPLPDIGEVLAPLLARTTPERRPLLIAIAERLAAERYFGWATEPAYAEHHGVLLRCARREEEIAARVESLYPDAVEQLVAVRKENPDLEDINRRVFSGRPIADQMTIQARGERLGASTWRTFAKSAEEPYRETFLACARLEEENAEVLEEILGLDA